MWTKVWTPSPNPLKNAPKMLDYKSGDKNGKEIYRYLLKNHGSLILPRGKRTLLTRFAPSFLPVMEKELPDAWFLRRQSYSERPTSQVLRLQGLRLIEDSMTKGRRYRIEDIYRLCKRIYVRKRDIAYGWGWFGEGWYALQNRI